MIGYAKLTLHFEEKNKLSKCSFNKVENDFHLNQAFFKSKFDFCFLCKSFEEANAQVGLFIIN